MNILLLRGFNNYFNRIVKKYTTLADYKSHSAGYLEFTGVNFNPNDGVATELILGSPAQQESSAPLAWDQLGTPDYLICSETVNNTTTIKFRWFVLESERTRDGQYRLALKRDIVAEHFNEIMSAQCFVEKGYITNTASPLLRNSEGGSYNQIKQSETLLKDATGVAWLVGYMKKTSHVAEFSKAMDSDLSMYTSYDSLPWKDCITLIPDEGSQTSATKTAVIEQPNKSLYFTLYNNYWTYKWAKIMGDTSRNNVLSYEGGQTSASYQGTNSAVLISNRTGWNDANDDWIPSVNSMNSLIINNATVRNAYNNMLSVCANDIISRNSLFATNANLNSYNGTYIVKDNVLYKLSVVQNTTPVTYDSTFNFSTGAANQAARSFFDAIAGADSHLSLNSDSATTAKLKLAFSTYSYSIVATETQPPTALTMELYAQNDRNGLNDELYDMFAIPYSNVPVNFTDHSGTTRALDNAASMFVAIQLMTKLGTANVNVTGGGSGYDLQLLPYCPLPLDSLSLVGLDAKSYYEVKQSTTPKTFILFPTEANFTRNITISRLLKKTVNGVTRDYNPLDIKVSNECDFCRLTSPNFNGTFEFKLAKFNEGMHYVNVDCTYKPYSPYIKLNPDFSGLYGADFNDSTGLILGGDFSLSTLSDAWINYELNNKNYQAIFNRQIQSLDVSNQIAQEQMKFNNSIGLLTGTIGGITGGAMTGAKAGPYGAIAGAAAGGLAGGLMASYGAQLNEDWLIRQQSESRSYTIDMYNYQLGNIKALPQTITKSNPLTYTNKIWPILEEYSATDTEKAALENKIAYNGMNIMTIGTLGDYSSSDEIDIVYVKGQLIRLEDVHDDFHIIDAIYQEVDKGFYIPQ